MAMSDSDRNNGPSTGRNRNGRFASGNPGRPHGARHKATLAAEAILDGEAEELTRKAVERALDGDSMALRLCLERILPPRKERPVTVPLPDVTGPAAAREASAALIAAAATGELALGEAEALVKLLEVHMRLVETAALADRVAALEAAAGATKGSGR
jgi:hypothetical protein